MNRLITTTAMATVVVASCGGTTATVDEDAVTYWQDDACAQVAFPELENRAGWNFCVEQVVATEGMLEYHVRWTGLGLLLTNVDKLSDRGNSNMYVVDDRGNRYDHVATRGAAAEDTRLDSTFPSAAGVFVFPAAAADATSFTFEDDDQGVATRPIRLDPLASTDRKTSLEQLAEVLEASSIQIRNRRSGFEFESDDAFTITRTENGFHMDGPERGLPEKAVVPFLATLATAPILERDYEPTWTHTDDSRFVGIELQTSNGVVTFGSRSQGAGMVPWYVDVAGTAFVIPDDTPARALKHLEDHLSGFQISVRDERPQYSGKVTSTGDTELVEAARSGNADRVRELIAEGRDVHERSPYDGSTPIGAATAAGDEDAIDALAREGADVEAPSAYGDTPLAEAAAAGSTGTASALLRAGANPDTRSGRLEQSPLMLAAENGHTETVRLLVDEGASVNARNSYGGTALMRAVKNNYPDIVADLIAAGSDVNAVAQQSGTALMQASRPDIVTMLVEAGAEVNATDDAGRTALMRVGVGTMMFKHTGLTNRDMEPADVPGTVRALLRAGADRDARDDSGRTPLLWAADEGGEPAVHALVDAGVDVNQEDDDGRTALFYVVVGGSLQTRRPFVNVELMRFLLSRGADPLHEDAKGDTVMDLAIRHEKDRTIKVLREARPDVAARSLRKAAESGNVVLVMKLLRGGMTPDGPALAAAVEAGHRSIVEVLVLEGADANVVGSDGLPILITAVRRGDPETVQFLLQGHAEPNVTTRDGQTAMELALESKEIHIAGLLKEAGAEGEMPTMGTFSLCWIETPDGAAVGPCEDPMEIYNSTTTPNEWPGRPVVKP